ncbi:MAG: Beta-ketoacyl synthase, partial [Myxococcaceae bacterium]|nr:Beta-ketoacyl synthase [Myxococcaceae bacterium]
KRLAAEGCELFSFGATLGVVVGPSPNPHPAVENALRELGQAGLFSGEGNFQFKNKYRPENLPIYLCQPASASPTDVSAVILLIASPTVRKSRPAQSENAHETSETSSVRPLSAGEAPELPRALVPSDSRCRAELRSVGWNPLLLPRLVGGFEMVTDSWAERDEAAIADRARELAERAGAICQELSAQTSLPFSYVQAASSGRAAEAALLRAIGPKRTIIQTNLFPSWSFNALDLGFRPVSVRVRPDSGDVDVEHLVELLAKHRENAGLCCIELAPNATGGLPMSLENARSVSEAVRAAGIPLVFDATRGIDNAYLIARKEGRDLWTVVRELFSLATALTLSLSKDFGVTSGGLVATSDPALAQALRGRVADRGEEVSLPQRRVLAAALDDTAWVEAAVRTRVEQTERLAAQLRAAGADVGASGAHAILLDAAKLCGRDYAHPVPALLAWLYEHAGVRAAPHLAAGYVANASCVRLAVPLGLRDDEVEQVGNALAAAFREHGGPTDLVRMPSQRGGRGDTYEPREHLPDDVAQDLEQARQGAESGENWTVVSSCNALVQRRLVEHEGGKIEIFDVGRGPVVVLLHPFNIGLGFFAPQFRELASTRRIIGVHAPGVGATTCAADLSFAGLARTVRSAVRAIGVEQKFIVVGASFGGLTALSVAHHYPGEVAGLVLLGSSHKVGNRKGDVNRLAVVAREDFDELGRAGTQLDAPREELEALLLRCESIDPRIGLRYLDQFAARPDLLADAASLKVPTLIIHGRHDTVINREVAQLLHRTVVGSRYVEVLDAGHFPSLTAAAEVNALLSGFVQEVEST